MFDRKFGEIKFINKFNLIQKVGVDKSYHFSIHLEKERKIFLRRRNIKNDLFNNRFFNLNIFISLFFCSFPRSRISKNDRLN